MKVRNKADFNRMDLSKSQRKRYHRTLKLQKRNWHRIVQKEMMDKIRDIK